MLCILPTLPCLLCYIYIFSWKCNKISWYDYAQKVYIPSDTLKSSFFWGVQCPTCPYGLRVLPPGHGRSVTDFWGWDAHEAQLRSPDDVSGDIGGCSARRALKPKFYQPTHTMVTAGILPYRENSHDRAGNRTRDLMISGQRLWPLDHEAGPPLKVFTATNLGNIVLHPPPPHKLQVC